MTKIWVRHETPATARHRAGGTGVAFTGRVIGMGTPVRRVREAGVTLIEALVVLAIIALVTAIVMVPVNSYWQRSRLETTAGDIRNFLQQAYVEAVNQHSQITVTMQQVSGVWTLQITPAPPHAPAAYAIPDFVSLSLNPAPAAGGWPTVGGVATLICDTKGLTICPSGATGTAADTCDGVTQVRGVKTLSITHVSMVDGSLTPNTRYDVQVYPLWNVSVVKVLV